MEAVVIRPADSPEYLRNVFEAIRIDSDHAARLSLPY